MSNSNCSKQSIKVGDTFQRWTVIGFGRDSRGKKSNQCQCKCGNIRYVRKEKLLNGSSRSCGCLRDEELTKHGMTKNSIRSSSHEYWVWNAMVQRCTNTNDRGYMNYGGRGITVHPDWLKFEGFYRDMGSRPGKGYSLEREDNDKGYGPDNCKWATRKQQNTNKRNNKIIKAFGEEKCLAEWSRDTGISHATILQRLKNGWSIEAALSRQVREGNYRRGPRER